MADAHAKSRLSFRQAAEQILDQLKTPLKPEEIVRHAIDAGLLVTTGRTPINTMAAQLYSEIQQHGNSSMNRPG